MPTLGLAVTNTPTPALTGAEDAASGDSSRVIQMARDFAESEGTQAAAAVGGRLEIEPGTLDSRIRLASCQQAEAFLPPNGRIWGRSRVGVRCKEGARWTVFVPVEARIFSQVAVSARAIQSGQTITAEDIRIAEVDITREAQGISADGRELLGRIATRNLMPGTPLQASLARARTVLQQGDLVKLVYLGRGFTVESEGRAVAAAADGEPVRVQVESGRVIAGTARDGRRVEIR
jgi:flagella basal body P-ring formation protein FlgA